jgi:hypothetical protein
MTEVGLNPSRAHAESDGAWWVEPAHLKSYSWLTSDNNAIHLSSPLFFLHSFFFVVVVEFFIYI